ncbi:MAG: hypothetical protein LBT88_07165 [Oscillospiraceae bacterium]|jgi:hypothetical protein|nr:hypothetical protein [Oscillospiraceae bacterium]
MRRKKDNGFLKFLSVLGVIISVVSVAATVIYYWDTISNAVRKVFPNLPKIKLFGGDCCGGKEESDEVPDEFDDFADV